jgi:large subunit ribosomal protein L15
MKLHDLHPASGSRRKPKRVGRGIAAGQGKTAGRGQKGQFSRSNPGLPKGFEGGQMPLSQRLPKLRGFHNKWRKELVVVNIGKLNRFQAGSVVDAAALRAAGLIDRARHGVKLLSAGELRVALTVRVHRASASARAAVEKAGGRLELLETRKPAAAPKRAARKRAAAEPAEEEPMAAAAAEPAPAAGAAEQAHTAADAEEAAMPELSTTSVPEKPGAPDEQASQGTSADS